MNDIWLIRESRDQPLEEDRQLYIYNPHLLPLRNLSSAILEKLLPNKVVGSRSRMTEAITTKYTYLALYRVTTFSSCLGPKVQNGLRNAPKYGIQNYLGISFVP